MSYLKVEGNDSLVRDISNKAIINTNNKAYDDYIKKRNSAKLMKEQIISQQEQINSIKSDVTEIKELLIQLLNK
jgi:hypothetical protein